MHSQDRLDGCSVDFHQEARKAPPKKVEDCIGIDITEGIRSLTASEETMKKRSQRMQ